MQDPKPGDMIKLEPRSFGLILKVREEPPKSTEYRYHYQNQALTQVMLLDVFYISSHTKSQVLFGVVGTQAVFQIPHPGPGVPFHRFFFGQIFSGADEQS